jgi:hypothetical protein
MPQHVVSYPIAKGSLINLVAFFSQSEEEGVPCQDDSVQEVPLQEVLERFEGWEEEVMVLLEVPLALIPTLGYYHVDQTFFSAWINQPAGNS